MGTVEVTGAVGTGTVWVARPPEPEVICSGLGVEVPTLNICLGMATMPSATLGVTRQIRKAKTAMRIKGTIARAEQPIRLGGLYKGYSSGSRGRRGSGVVARIIYCLLLIISYKHIEGQGLGELIRNGLCYFLLSTLCGPYRQGAEGRGVYPLSVCSLRGRLERAWAACLPVALRGVPVCLRLPGRGAFWGCPTRRRRCRAGSLYVRGGGGLARFSASVF